VGAAPFQSLAGLAAGTAVVAVVHALLGRSLQRRGLHGLGPADRVTLLRAWLTCGVLALVVGVTGEGRGTAPLVAVAGTALALDTVDGWVARRTGTASALGARFDMEVDALLILVLSVQVARAAGWWVLTIGLARYAVLAAAVVAPWLRAGVAPRRWRKMVAAVQGVVLTVAVSGLLPAWSTTVSLAVAAWLLGVSFLTEVAELWRRRATTPGTQMGRVGGVGGLTVGHR